MVTHAVTAFKLLECADPAADGPVQPSANETGGGASPVKCSSNIMGQMRLITPVYGDEDAGQAERRLAEFSRAIVPVLDEFLPK